MIKCPNCGSLFDLSKEMCPECKFFPSVVDGIALWSPKQADVATEFDSRHYETLAMIEDENFWFLSRNSLLTNRIKKHFSKLSSFLEIGCGTGFVLSAVKKAFPRADIVGSELLLKGLYYASERIKDAKFIQMDGRTIHYRNAFDVIGIFDVLEHIEEDQLVLSQIYKAVKPGGGMILTVPQHPSLWSKADKIAGHVRRYKVGEVEKKVENAGFKVIESTSFVSFLLPLMFLSRKLTSNSNDDTKVYEFKMPNILNKLFRLVMLVELKLINLGFSFPVGGSRLVIAKKKNK